MQRESKSHGAHWEREHFSWCPPNLSEPWIPAGWELRTAYLSSTGVTDPLVLCHLTAHSPSHRLHTIHQKKRLLLAPTAPKVAGPVPPRWTQASHPSPLRSALWEHPSSLHVPFHSKLLHSHPTRAISRNKVRQAMPPARREATTATSVHSLQRSGAVTLLSVQPETEQAGASGKRRGSGWKPITTAGTPPAPAGAKMLLYHFWVQQSIWTVWDCCQHPRMG